MAMKVHMGLEDLHQHCRDRGMHVELDVDDRAIKGRDSREIVRVRAVRDAEQRATGKPFLAGSAVCSLDTLDAACRRVLEAL